MDRGRLHVSFGAAPGVGKTFTMLEAGHRLQREGRDVAVGFFNTHDRADVSNLLQRLQMVAQPTLVEESAVDEAVEKKPTRKRR